MYMYVLLLCRVLISGLMPELGREGPQCMCGWMCKGEKSVNISNKQPAYMYMHQLIHAYNMYTYLYPDGPDAPAWQWVWQWQWEPG